jgi:hypothetical protein
MDARDVTRIVNINFSLLIHFVIAEDRNGSNFFLFQLCGGSALHPTTETLVDELLATTKDGQKAMST